ncbi:Hsp70 family protein [Nonomuraea phyllanthi]|uniref:Hsp70 family protein n=1 Tax=Nonomuraea phyllanthi TaxID=2219224 RepID=UPI001292D8B7|nr:Hsp70 family protein [Nonomuraea phyllanthi]QFY12974.1 Hsp70 family protein [Nonomuraea phyllanthi]
MTYGIDFGTSNSVVARFDGEATEVLPIGSENVPAQWHQPEYEMLFPSVVSVGDLQRTLCFGWAAKTTTSEPVDAVKRLLGTRSAGIGQGDSGVPHLGEDHVWIANEPFRSTAVAASLFVQMKAASERNFLDLTEAVVTVPANAAGGARYRTRAAARLAGIKVKAMLNEPTAAAISYANDIDIPGRLLVFDWGGGTIDVTILEYDGKYFEELTSRGIAALGGLEFDEALARIVLTKLGQRPEKLTRRERQRWRRNVELTKIALSRRELSEVPFDIPALGTTITISREEYVEAVAPLIEHAMEPLQQALDDLDYGPDDIDSVLMIGGTSQVPEARDAVGRVLGEDRIVDPALCHPMTAVARGAAIYSAALDDPSDRYRFSLVTNYDLGTAVAAGPHKGFKPIIKRNRTLIARGEQRFTPSKPDAVTLNVEVIEGEEGYPPDGERAFPLAHLQVRLPKPERIPERNAVIIQFRYDHSGILQVKVLHEHTKRVLMEQEIDSFGEDGTRLQQGLDRELRRLLAHVEVPFHGNSTERSDAYAVAELSEHASKKFILEGEGLTERASYRLDSLSDNERSDDALMVNGIAQTRV